MTSDLDVGQQCCDTIDKDPSNAASTSSIPTKDFSLLLATSSDLPLHLSPCTPTSDRSSELNHQLDRSIAPIAQELSSPDDAPTSTRKQSLKSKKDQTDDMSKSNANPGIKTEPKRWPLRDSTNRQVSLKLDKPQTSKPVPHASWTPVLHAPTKTDQTARSTSLRTAPRGKKPSHGCTLSDPVVYMAKGANSSRTQLHPCLFRAQQAASLTADSAAAPPLQGMQPTAQVAPRGHPSYGMMPAAYKPPHQRYTMKHASTPYNPPTGSSSRFISIHKLATHLAQMIQRRNVAIGAAVAAQAVTIQPNKPLNKKLRSTAGHCIVCA